MTTEPTKTTKPARLTSSDFKVGMRVKVREDQLSGYLPTFAQKVQNREALVLWVSKYDNYEDARKDRFYAGHVNRIQIEFQKRNGRGKPFKEMMVAGDFEIIAEPN